MEKVKVHANITGRVQMVGFRYFTKQWAEDFYLTGWVRNNRDGSVELEAEGKKTVLESFIKEIRQGPRISNVDDVKLGWLPFKNEFRKFEIRY